MKKQVNKIYLNEEEESLVISSINSEVDHGLPFDCCVVAKQLHNIFKSVKYRCGDNDVQEKSSLTYFWEVINRVNKKEDYH